MSAKKDNRFALLLTKEKTLVKGFFWEPDFRRSSKFVIRKARTTAFDIIIHSIAS